MSRLPMLPPHPEDPAAAALFDEVRSYGVELPNLYRVLGHAPAMLRAWLDLAWPLRLNAKTSRALRELVILRGSQIADTEYERVHHVQMALAAGVPQAKLDALANWRSSRLFDDAERAALRMAEEVTRGPAASADCMAELARHYTPSEQIELVLTSSFYACVGRICDSFEVELEDRLKR